MKIKPKTQMIFGAVLAVGLFCDGVVQFFKPTFGPYYFVLPLIGVPGMAYMSWKGYRLSRSGDAAE